MKAMNENFWSTLGYCDASAFGKDEFTTVNAFLDSKEYDENIDRFNSEIRSSATKSSKMVTFYNEAGIGVSGVNIYSKSNTSKGTITNENGVADLSSFAPDEILVISHVAYVNFESKRDSLFSSEILQSETNALDEVVITAEKKKFPFWVLGAVAVGVLLLFGGQEKTPKPTAALNGSYEKKREKKVKKPVKRIHV